MKTIGFTMVKNEEDIIEQFVRHNLHHLDKIYVFDHGSSDNTVEIVNRLVAEGLPVVRIFDHANAFGSGYAQAEIMSALFGFAMQENGNAVYFPIDADEFVQFRGSDAEYRAFIDALPENTCVNVAGIDMNFPEDAGEAVFADVPKSFGLIRSWESSRGSNFKAIIKVTDARLLGHLSVAQGNHGMFLDGQPLAKDYAAGEALRYMHVPVRSPQQAFRKFVCGWFSNVQKFGKDTPYANHWKIAFDRICAGSDTGDVELAHMLNKVYLGEVDTEKDFDAVDASRLFKYELKYAALRTRGLGVTLRSIESDFHRLFLKSQQ